MIANMREKYSSGKEREAYVRKAADLIRYDLVAMLSFCGSGHPGGSLSIVEIMSALYFGGILRFDPAHPKLSERDRLILSKGHASPTQYVVLAQLGYFPKSWLREFDANGSNLPKHCDRFKTPGIEASTGALGQGISMAVGFAAALKTDVSGASVFTVIGDGECQSGNTYEAARSASKFNLGNLKVILDDNNLQIDGTVSEVMPLGDVAGTWKSLGWEVLACDGHNIGELLSALELMKSRTEKPQLLIAKTVKGKGVSFMENNADWHSDKITKELAKTALREAGKPLTGTGLAMAEFLSREELAELCGKEPV
jgi:transketolase